MKPNEQPMIESVQGLGVITVNIFSLLKKATNQAKEFPLIRLPADSSYDVMERV